MEGGRARGRGRLRDDMEEIMIERREGEKRREQARKSGYVRVGGVGEI